ncbi:MAG: formylglycine-generating enzyme family protein [Acidimicrobiales bacterium]
MIVEIDSATFLLGSDDPWGYPSDGEGPVREVRLSAYALESTAVDNEHFRDFVAATGYRTTAEEEGWSFVFAGLLADDFEATRSVASTPWWRQVFGASWHQPVGPGSTVDDRPDHPVVHISWNDALVYAHWAGGRLLTEAEWEYAARGGIEQATFPWGDDETPGGEHRCNTWQGEFPLSNTVDDGWYDTAPVGSFIANGFGLHNMVGNVWEWCSDWFTANHEAGPLTDPTGPPVGNARAMRGGSYLCHKSYCFRYRNSARSSNTPDSGTGNLGFRVAYDR